jgi:spore maturation protein CgeB
MRDLERRGHQALALEPLESWSRANLVRDQGREAEQRFSERFPGLKSLRYGADFDHEQMLADADVVIVHEWTDPGIVERVGRAREAEGRFTLLFHDTHHRAVSAEADIATMRLEPFDGILAFGEALRERYLDAGWGRSVFTWHEAADDTLFRPMPEVSRTGDLVWIGNWGDDERTEELRTYLMDPVQALGLKADVYGVRYPDDAKASLDRAGIAYRGWTANADVPRLFAQHAVTVHIPRRPYVTHLPGIPTIRVFEALACGIPLVSAPWSDVEDLFRANRDYLLARDGDEMTRLLRDLLADEALRAELAKSGLETIRARHTCRHRVDELFRILAVCGTRRVIDQLDQQEAAE